jgi:PAS domain S-box-containing protein
MQESMTADIGTATGKLALHSRRPLFLPLLALALLLAALLPSQKAWGHPPGDQEVRTEQILESILRSAPTGIGMVENRVLVQVNEYILQLTGYSRGELLGQSARMLYPTQEEFDFVGREKYRQISEKGTGSLETRWQRKDSSIRNVLLSSTPLDLGDLAKGVTFTVLDITEAKQAAAALATRTKWFLVGSAAFVLLLLTLIARLVAGLRQRDSALAALRESRENLATTLHSIGDGVIATDTQGRVTSMNPVAERLCGWPLAEARGKPLTEVFRIVNALTREAADDPVASVLASGQVVGLANHTLLLARDGAEYQIADSAAPIRGNGDKTIGVVLVFSDATEKYARESAIKAEREQLLSIFNSIDEIIYITDTETHELLYANQKLASVLQEDCIGEKCYKVLQGRDTPCPFCTNEIILEQKPAPYAWEYYNPLLDKHFSIVDRIIQWSDGRDVRFEMAVDVTERKKAEEALRASEAKFHSLFASMQELVVLHEIVLDERGEAVDYRILDCNPAFTASTGLSREEVVGRLASEVYGTAYGAGPAPYLDVYARVALTGEPHAFETYFPPMDKHFRISAVSHARNSFATVTSDITQAKRNQEALRAAKDAAEAASRAKSEFLANMSHEIRTPLNGILGMLQLIKHTPLDMTQGEYVDVATQSSLRLTRLLTDILDLSRIEAGRLPMVTEPFSLAEALGSVEQLFRPVALQTGVDLRVQVDPAIPESLLGDPLRLQQIFNNLVGNASKFTSSGSIEVTAHPLPEIEAGQSRVLFTVADTGCGIPDDRLGDIFQPFTQVSEGLRRSHQGAGLGLAICKQLIEIMGGSIEVDSEVSVGTTIYICMPFDLPSVRQAAMDDWASSVPFGTRNRGLRVLIAEDDTVSAVVCKKLLQGIGASVEVAEDGQQALDALRREPFDLVLMDIQMPVMEGVEATRAIRRGEAGEDRKHIPIIAMTAYAMAGDREKLLEAGMDGYVAKPVEMDELLDAIQRVLPAPPPSPTIPG